MQKKAAKLTVEKVGKQEKLVKREILAKAGFSEAIQKNPDKVFETEGFKVELRKLGFDPDNAKSVVGEILVDETNEPRDRLKAAEMVFKVHGSFAPEKHANLNVNVNQEAGDIDLDLLVKEAENKLKEAKLNVETK